MKDKILDIIKPRDYCECFSDSHYDDLAGEFMELVVKDRIKLAIKLKKQWTEQEEQCKRASGYVKVDERQELDVDAVRKFIKPLMVEIFLPAKGKTIKGFLSDREPNNLAQAIVNTFKPKVEQSSVEDIDIAVKIGEDRYAKEVAEGKKDVNVTKQSRTFKSSLLEAAERVISGRKQ